MYVEVVREGLGFFLNSNGLFLLSAATQSTTCGTILGESTPFNNRWDPLKFTSRKKTHGKKTIRFTTSCLPSDF